MLVCRFGKGMKPSELTIGQAVRDRPSGRALESQMRWDAWREGIVAWAS